MSAHEEKYVYVYRLTIPFVNWAIAVCYPPMVCNSISVSISMLVIYSGCDEEAQGMGENTVPADLVTVIGPVTSVTSPIKTKGALIMRSFVFLPLFFGLSPFYYGLSY